MLHVSTIPAADLREGMTLANGALVLAADIDENGALDYATHLFGTIAIHSVEAADLASATVTVAEECRVLASGARVFAAGPLDARFDDDVSDVDGGF